VALVTAGVISPEPLAELLPHVDAVSLTIKGYTEAFYREVCGAHPADVWSACRQIVAAGRWLEAAILVVPGMNDEEPGWRSVARSLARLDPDIPVHFLRFAPAFKLRHVPPTPVPTLERLREVVAHEGLRHVYLDLSGHGAANTYCPACKTLLIERVAFRVLHSRLRDGRCPRCRTSLPGVRLAPA
jgi:pyruvate formate lyase activating enzyme